MADERFAVPSAHVSLNWTQGLVFAQPWPHNRSYVRLRAVASNATEAAASQTQVPSRPVQSLSLDLLRYEVLPNPPAPPPNPTYVDGFWSIHDLFRGPDLEPGLAADVTAYVCRYDPGMVHRCVRHAKGSHIRTCRASVPPTVLISDTQLESDDSIVLSAHLDANGKRRPLPTVGGPYLIHGTSNEELGVLSARRGEIIVHGFRSTTLHAR